MSALIGKFHRWQYEPDATFAQTSTIIKRPHTGSIPFGLEIGKGKLKSIAILRATFTTQAYPALVGNYMGF